MSEHDPTAFMRNNGEAAAFPPDIPTDRPTAARAYGICLGSKDNFQVDRDLVAEVHRHFPAMTDIARQNRLFLYRAVRHLASDAGIDQFLDLGSGLPTENNVHQVAHDFQPRARVVYVDNDPIVSAHGRALLADNDATGFIDADFTDPAAVLTASETRRLIDPDRPVGVLMFSIPHCIPDDEAARRAVRGCIGAAAPGSYLALSHVVADDTDTAARITDTITAMGLPWKTRLAHEVDAWVADLHPVAPGLVDIDTWRPDPGQPPLSPPHPIVARYLGASRRGEHAFREYGGVLRKP